MPEYRPHWFQSTRPRGARRLGHLVSALLVAVSIHAPARGATFAHGFVSLCRIVSIHAPARGATRPDVSPVTEGSGFNPRAREGRDGKAERLEHHVGGFNPRAREGRDAKLPLSAPYTICFNPRAREGRDLSISLDDWEITGFNPRAREGRDRSMRPKEGE